MRTNREADALRVAPACSLGPGACITIAQNTRTRWTCKGMHRASDNPNDAVISATCDSFADVCPVTQSNLRQKHRSRVGIFRYLKQQTHDSPGIFSTTRLVSLGQQSTGLCDKSAACLEGRAASRSRLDDLLLQH